VLRRSGLEQLTSDHTLARRLAESGVLDPSEVDDSPLDHVLWKALGAGRRGTLRPDVIETRLDPGDALLLATDGLSKQVSAAEIEATLRLDEHAKTGCRLLIEQAVRAGSEDDTTVVVARFFHPPAVARPHFLRTHRWLDRVRAWIDTPSARGVALRASPYPDDARGPR
jgi:protein phosphatase